MRELAACICGPRIDSLALQKSHRHDLVLITKSKKQTIVFRDEHLASALLWRNVAEGNIFTYVGGSPVRPLAKLQFAACSAALFEASFSVGNNRGEDLAPPQGPTRQGILQQGGFLKTHVQVLGA